MLPGAASLQSNPRPITHSMVAHTGVPDMDSIFRKMRVVASLLALLATGGPLRAQPPESASAAEDERLQTATFGGGCFWCVEAVFERLEGVEDVVSGYAGGRTANPTYEQVLSGFTGHAEVCQIRFDPQKVPYEKLLEVFWTTHDPTTRNRQGPDIGSQYRSVIFYHSPEQKALAQKYQKLLDESGAYPRKSVTEIRKAINFYPAEPKHQDYFRSNPQDRYCVLYAQPKIEKLKKVFPDLVQDENEPQ